MNRIDEAIRHYRMLSPGERVVVGLSGGADSVALTHFLKFSFGADVIACHVNHHLRGEESDRDMYFVEALCREWGIPLEIRHADILALAGERGNGEEEAGRTARYTFFDEVLVQSGAQKIATAHTLSDNMETVLLHLARGTGLGGLCGIPPVRGRIIRPLIWTGREEIEAYCAAHDLDFRTDSTNADTRYARNRVRWEVIPALCRVHPGMEENFRRSVRLLSEEEAYLNGQAETAYASCLEGCGLSIEKLRLLDPVLLRRVLGIFCERHGISKSVRRICTLEGMISSGAGKLTIACGSNILLKRGMLLWEEDPIPPYPPILLGEGHFRIPDGDFIAEICEKSVWESRRKIYKNLLYLSMDYDTIEGKVSIRQRISGDALAVAGRGGTKTVKKLFIEAGLTPWEKSVVPVFTDEEGIIALGGFGPASRCAVTGQTERVLTIWRKEEN